MEERTKKARNCKKKFVEKVKRGETDKKIEETYEGIVRSFMREGKLKQA